MMADRRALTAKPLVGTVALVTGASSGIGEATARALAQQGAVVAAVARRKERLDRLVEEIRSAGGEATAIAADVADPRAAAGAVATAVSEHGRLDTVVNNAGVMLLGPIVDAPTEEWDRMLDVNVRGLLAVTNAALPHLLEAASTDPRRVADLVNISSVAGRVVRAGSGVYNLTKWGVNAFSESLRQEVTTRYVRVSVVEPGAVATELTDHLRPEIQEVTRERMSNVIPLEADDIAEAIVYIVTRRRDMAVNEVLVRPTTQAL